MSGTDHTWDQDVLSFFFVLPPSSDGDVCRSGGHSSGSGSGRSSRSAPAAKSSSLGGLASVARLVKLGRCRNVVVVAGAGISTASGIPDFRLVSVGLVPHSLL